MHKSVGGKCIHKKFSEVTQEEINEMQTVFKKHQSPKGWKEPFTAIVEDPNERDMLVEGIRWNHADDPVVERTEDTVYIRHKEGLVTFAKTIEVWKVKSRGYQG